MEIIEVSMPVGMGVDVDVLENLKKAKIARAQGKTLEELEIINERVQRIFDDYELGEQMSAHAKRSNIEFLADIAELQAILNDSIKKNKYQKKITIFIVGFQDSCSKRLQLLNQISEFFETYGAPDEVAEIQDSLMGIDVEEINENIQTALDTMDSAFTKLNDLNHDIVECMNSMHSALTSKSALNKKKLEKNLTLAKEDLLKVTDKLQSAQQELKAKDEQIHKISRQMDNKTKEIYNLKSQLDKAKRSLDTAEKEKNEVRFMFEDDLRRLRIQLDQAEKELREFKNEKATSYKTKIQEILDASLEELIRMKGTLTQSEEDQINFRKEISLQYRVQTRQIEYLQSEELAQILFEYRKRLSQALEIEVTEDDVQQWGQDEEQDKQSEDEEAEEQTVEQAETELPPAMTPQSLLGSGQFTEDESSPTSPRQLISSTIEPLKQPIDLTDEEFWENVSEKEMPVRFAEYREEALRQIDELRRVAAEASPNDELLRREKEKKKKWKEEKATLLDHIQQLQRLQEEAEADANEAMKQLEELAAQQDEIHHVDTNDPRRVISSADMHEESQLSSREQGTSPDLPKNPSSVSKKSVVDLVEKRREAMMKRKQDASTILNSDNNLSESDVKAALDTETFENFSESYKTVLEFKKHVAEILSHYPQSRQASKKLDGSLEQFSQPEENESKSMARNVQATLSTVESVLKSFVTSVRDTKEKVVPQIPLHSASGNSDEIEDLQNKIDQLQTEMEAMRLEYQRRRQQDSEMIQQLQHTLANGKHDNIPSNMQITTNTPSATAPVNTEHMLTLNQGNRSHTVDTNVTMMFTRLDSEHNTKTLMNSAKTGKINQTTLDSLVVTMEGYNEVAGARLQQLVQKIVHHTKMKEIEINVRNSNLVTSEVFDVLEKMEELQRKRAQNWSKQMDELTTKRNRLGLLLQDAMQRLEKITGVFLIKPIISHQGKEKTRAYSGKISTKFNKYQMEAMAAKEQSKRMAEPHHIKVRMSAPQYNPVASRGAPWTAQGLQPTSKQGDRDGLTVSGLRRMDPPPMWSLGASLPQSVPSTKNEKWSPGNPPLPSTVPKLVELDVGRFLHEVNPVHTFTVSQKNSPRAIPGPSRSYTGVSRSIGKGSIETARLSSGRQIMSLDRPHATNTIKTDSSADDYQSTAPPTTPASQILVHRGSTGFGITTPNSDQASLGTPNLPRPLPPIQISNRSQASTRSSFTGSPTKDYGTPSPTKSLPLENASPVPRSQTVAFLPDGDNVADRADVSPLQPFVEIAN